MASDFDGLVGALLNHVALTGRYGFGVEELEKYATVTLNTPAEPELLLKAWEWLSNHMEIESSEVDNSEAMDLDQNGDPSAEPNARLEILKSQLGDRRLFVSEARMWDAIAGHPRDLKRLPRLEFDCLSIIAQRGAVGILQPELVRITGQDKRSVPKRTDLLASKGYIVKYPVLAETSRGVKTSLLKLKKYETDEVEQIVMNYDTWFSEAIRIFKSQPNWVVAYQDLRIGLGIEGKKRETRVLARCVRRLANAGCINRIVVREQVNATEVGRPVRCLQLMREPTQDDRIAWETIGLRTQSRRLNPTDPDDNDDDDEDEEEDAFQDEETEGAANRNEATPLPTANARSKSRVVEDSNDSNQPRAVDPSGEVNKNTALLSQPPAIDSEALQNHAAGNQAVSLPVENELAAATQPEPSKKRGRGGQRKDNMEKTPLRKPKSKYMIKDKLGERESIMDFSPAARPAVNPSTVATSTSIAPTAGAPTQVLTPAATINGSSVLIPTTQPPASSLATPVANPLTVAARRTPFTSSPITSLTPKKRGRPTKQMVAERERLASLTPDTSTRKSARGKARGKARVKTLLVKLKVDGTRLKNFANSESVKTVVKPTSMPKETARTQSLATPLLQVIRPYYGESTASKGKDAATAQQTGLDKQSKDSTLEAPLPEAMQSENINNEIDDENDQTRPADAEHAEPSEDDAYVPADGDESQHSDLNIDDSSDEEFAPKKGKTRAYRPRAVTQFTVETLATRHKNLILEIVRNHGNVYPGNGELWHPFSKTWKRTHSSLPPQDAIASVVEDLVSSGELKKLVFSFETEAEGSKSSTILALPSVDPVSEKVKEVETGIAAAWPAEYHPARHWARDSFVPVDSMVVTRTTKGLSWADKEAQSFGYANAEERKLTLTQKNARKGQGSARKSSLKATKVPKTPEAKKSKRGRKPKYATPSALPVGYDSEDYESDTSLPRIDPGIALDSHPGSMNEILDMASRLGFPAANGEEDPQEHFDKDVDRVKQWELAMISGDRFKPRPKERGFINCTLNQPHTTPILGESEWNLRPADGRAKGRKIPSAAQDNTIGQSAIFDPPVLARKPSIGQQEVASSPAPSADVDEEAPRKRYKSRKRKVQFDDDDNFSNTEMDAQSGNERPFKRNKRATSSFKDVERLVTAIALVRCICGGIQMHRMNWDLIAHALSFRYEGNFLRQRWSYFRNVHEGNVQRVQAALREPFLAAYEKGELPKINFQNLAATDMPALFDWVETVVLPLPEEDPSQLPSLPKNTAILQKRYHETGSLQYYEQPKDSYHQNVTDMHRRDLALAFVHGHTIPQPQIESIGKADNLVLLKSWCRAVAMTKQKAYKADVAAKKLGVFTGAMIKKANRELLDDQILSQEKKDRQLPGRNYYLSAAVYKQFKRWPEPEFLYLRKIIDSRAKLLSHFRDNDTIKLNYHADDSDLIVFHNMVAQGRLKTYSDIPERNDDFDAPWPRLTAWGYTDFDYRTKAVDKTRLTFPIVYEKTSTFSEEHGLKPAPVPLKPEQVPNEAGLRIPLWADIHDNLLDDAWDMVLRSVLHLIVFRPGITSEGIEISHKGKLGLWEVEMVMRWMEEAGIADRWASGNEEDGHWKGGWKANEWWYCAFAPDIATWKAPTA